MKKKFYIFFTVLTFISISLLFTNLRTRISIRQAGEQSIIDSNYIEDNIKLKKLFEEKEAFYSSQSPECVRLGANVVQNCCHNTGTHDSKVQIETFEVQCPPPNESDSLSFQCVSKSNLNLGLSEEEISNEPASRLCSLAINKYERDCNNGKRIDDNFCPQLKQSSGIASVYPTCESLDDYWNGSVTDNTGPKAPACDPLGAPPEIDIPLIPDPSTPVEFTSNPDGSDTNTTDETNGSGVSINLPPDFNKHTPIFRLEVPGNYARYFARSQYANELKTFNDYRGVDCSEDDLTCSINLTTLSRHDSTTTLGEHDSIITEELRNLNTDDQFIMVHNFYGENLDHDRPIGTQINQFVRTAGCPAETIINAAQFFNDPLDFGPGFFDRLGGFLTAYIIFPIFSPCELGLLWNGQISMMPYNESEGNITNFNLKDDFNVRFRNIHDPNSANGYQTNIEDFYFDKAGVIAGLDDKSCNILKNAKIKMPSKYTKAGYSDNWENRREETNEVHEVIEGKQYTFLKPYYCQCTEYYQVAKKDESGNPEVDADGNPIYVQKEDKEDDDNYCIYDLAPRDHDTIVEINMATDVTAEHIDSYGTSYKRSSRRSFELSLTLFKRDSDNKMSDTFNYVTIVNLLESWRSANSYVSETSQPDQELTYYYTRPTKLMASKDAVDEFIDNLEKSNDVRSYISDNFPSALSGATTALKNITDIQSSGIADLIGYCIENDNTLNPSQKQFHPFGDQALLYESSKLNLIGGTHFNLSNTDTTKEVDVFNDNFSFYGCNNFNFYSRYLKTQTHPNLGNTDLEKRIPSALLGDAYGKVDLGKYQVKVRNTGGGSSGFLWFYISLHSQIEYKKNQPLRNFGRWILKKILYVVSAVISWLSPLINFVVTTVAAPDGFYFDLGDLHYKAQGGLILNNAFEEYKTNLDARLRRITTNVPEIKVVPINEVSFDTPSCNLKENWHKVHGIKDFLSFLWDSGFRCPAERIGETVRFLFIPLRNLLWDILPWLNGLVSNIVSNLTGSLLVQNGDLNGYSDLITLVSNTFHKHTFNPNFTKDIPASSLIPAPSLSPAAAGLFGNFCTMGVDPELNCLVHQIMTTPNLGETQIKGCIIRGGAKTHFRSLNDVKINLGDDFIESFDFPPVRFCNSGDSPLEVDKNILKESSLDLESMDLSFIERWYYELNPSLLDSAETPTYDFLLNDLSEIDQIISSDGDLLGWRNQCALFTDLAFLGQTTLQQAISSSDFINHYIELIPTKRSNFFVNNFFTCVDGYSCNPENDPIHDRKTLAYCSLAADMWYTKDDTRTSMNPDEEATNLLTLLASEKTKDKMKKNKLYKLYKKVYCMNAADPNCPSDMDNSFDSGFKSIQPIAEKCLDLLSEAGVNIRFEYPEGRVIDKFDYTCESLTETEESGFENFEGPLN